MNSPELSTNPAVLGFHEAATACCQLIRAHRETEFGAFLASLERTLVRLYAAALELPDVDAESEELLPTAGTSEERMVLFQSLNAYLEPYSYYWEVYDPIVRQDGDILAGGLGDDLSDIYYDLRTGLEVWNPRDPIRTADVVWDWRFGFESHWGQHLVDGLRALHWMRHVRHVGETEASEDSNGTPDDRAPAG